VNPGFRDCPFCGGGRAEYNGLRGGGRVWRCRDCGEFVAEGGPPGPGRYLKARGWAGLAVLAAALSALLWWGCSR
jgi:hypothetical protein